MKSTQEQFWYIVNYCLDNYSEESFHKLGMVMNTHENVIFLCDLVQKNLPEDEFLAELSRLEKEGNDYG